MKVKIRYYENSFDGINDFAFEEIIETDNLEQLKQAAIYDCQEQDFDHYEIILIKIS